MKRAIKTILAVVCVTAIVLAGAENPDGSCNLFWTLGWMAAAVFSGLGYKKMEDAK